MIFAQTSNFRAISARHRYRNWRSDREIARRLFSSHGLVLGLFDLKTQSDTAQAVYQRTN
jgi:hypothetical protein